MLQTSWKQFAQRLPTEPDLDSIIRAHNLYLDEVVQKVRLLCQLPLLADSIAATQFCDSQVLLDEKSSSIYKLLVRLFDVVIKFCKIQDRLYGVVQAEAQRLASRKELQQKRLEKVRDCVCVLT